MMYWRRIRALHIVGAQHGIGTSSLAREASARVAASIISSLMVVARTSSAPRKMKGNPSTLFTWLGQSERPVATMASGRVATAIS